METRPTVATIYLKTFNQFIKDRLLVFVVKITRKFSSNTLGMDSLLSFYRSVSNTKALEKTCGNHERIFFEHVHRITYLTGLSTSDRGTLYMIYGLIVKLMIASLVFFEVWDFLTSFNSLDGIIDSINITFIQFIAIFKFISMNRNKHIFNTLARATESNNFDTSTPGRQELLYVWCRRNGLYILLVTGLGFGTLMIWNVYPLVDDLEYNLALAVHVPINYKTNIRYPIVYSLVQMALSYTGSFVMVVDITILTHLMYLLCQYTVLADSFENILIDCKEGFEGVALNTLLTNGKFRKKYKARLVDLVAQHILILNNTLKLKKILSAPMLGQLASSLILICSLGYQVALSVDNITKLLMSCLFLGYNMCELFIICRWCDDIRFQSENIGKAVFCSGWEYGLTTIPGVRRQLTFILLRASKPVVLTAGGMYDLSLVSFSNLVKTSYSALTVLLRLR